jgi:hypothetical protein
VIDGIGDGFTQVLLGRFLDVGQNKRGYLRRAVLFAPQVDTGVTIAGLLDLVRQDGDVILNFFGFELAADQPFYTENRVFRIGNRLPFGNLAHQSFTAVRYGNDMKVSSVRLRDW